MPKTTKKAVEKAAETVPKPTKTNYMLKMANGKTAMVTRRRRVPIPRKIRDKLERIFTEKVFPRGKGTMKARQEYMRKLAKECNLSFEQLRRWFDNRTQKEKKKNGGKVKNSKGKAHSKSKKAVAWPKSAKRSNNKATASYTKSL